jgi:uncharacterized membrane protein HdeD (DUF308 family)
MALIKCSECGKEISDKALACPNCGNPVHDTESNIRTIQLTKKVWKKRLLIGVALFIIGMFMFASGVTGGNSVAAWFGFFSALIGFFTMMWAKFGAWWSTG